jgi:hypothetical protein
MAKRELQEKIKVDMPNGWTYEYISVTEQEIVKPYIDKLKHQIHEKTFESGMMNPIMTYVEIMYMIDNLLSEKSEEE